MNKFKDLAIGIFFICATAFAGNLWWNARLAIQTITPKVSGTMFQLQLAAQTVQKTFKSQAEQLDKQEQIEAREKIQLGLQQIVQHAAYRTLPKLDAQLDALKLVTNKLSRATDSTNELISGVDKNLNLFILPNINQGITNLNKLSLQIGISAAEIEAEIVAMIKRGETTWDAVNKRLNDPKFDDILSMVLEIERDVHSNLTNTERITGNLAAATEPLPGFVKETVVWNGRIRKAQLLSILFNMFKPW